MRYGRGLGLGGFADLYRNDRFVLLLGIERQVLKGTQIAKAFDMQTKGCDAWVIQQTTADLRDADLGLVACSNGIGNRQAARLHGQVDRDVRALGDDGHTALDTASALLVGPQQSAIQIVDKAIAVRAQNRHVACGGEQLILQIRGGVVLG